MRLFGSSFLEQSESILKVANGSMSGRIESAEEPVVEDWGGEIIEAHTDEIGDIYETRRVRPIMKGRGSMEMNSVNIARNNYGVWNRSGFAAGEVPGGGNTFNRTGIVNVSGKAKCFRCGSDERYWGGCHFPWRKTLAFGPKGGSAAKLTEPVAAVLTDGTEKGESDGESYAKAGEGIGSECSAREGVARLTEEERIRKYNIQLVSVLTCTCVGAEGVIFDAITDGDRSQRAVLDIGETSNVVGVGWLGRNKMKISELSPAAATKRFRFVDSRQFSSLSSVCIQRLIPAQEVLCGEIILRGEIWDDVATCDISVLLPRASVKSMERKLDFPNNFLMLANGVWISLELAGNGHLFLPTTNAAPPNIRVGEMGLVSQLTMASPPAVGKSSPLLKKMHLHLAHASEPVLRRIIRYANRRVSDETMTKVMSSCPRRESHAKLHRAATPSYIP